MGSTRSQISTAARELQGIFENLTDKRVKIRKEGLQRLEYVLGNDVNLAILDALTFGVGPGNEQDAYACEYASWKAILKCLMPQVEESVAKALKKGQTPESMYSRVVRTVVNKAISKRNSSRMNVLEPCVAEILDHLSFIMEKTYQFRQVSQIYNDYMMTFKFLLDNGEYVVCMGPGVMDKVLLPLATIILDKIDSSRENSSNASFMVKDLTILRTILVHMEYDMSPDVKDSLLTILNRFGENDNLRDYTARICNEVVGICVQFMVYSAGDFRSELSNVVDKYHHSCMLLLREGNPDGKEVAIQFYRISIKLQLVHMVHIEDLIEWYHSINLEGAWEKAPESPEYTFNHAQSYLADLLGQLEIYLYEHYSSVSPHIGSSTHMIRSRQENLLSNTLKHPGLLGPVACIFIDQYGCVMEEKEFETICIDLEKEIQCLFQHSFVSEQVKPEVVWMLRLLYSTISAGSRRRSLTTLCSNHLGKAIAFLILQYNVLSNYHVTRDIIKSIIISALPDMHESIKLQNADTFKQELLSESPSPISMILFTLLIRYKKILLKGQDDVMLSCDWILESISLGFPSDAAAAAINTVVYGGHAVTPDIFQSLSHNLKKNIEWLKGEKLDNLIKSLPPVSKWSLYANLDKSMAFPTSKQASEPLKGNSNPSFYLKTKLEAALNSQDPCNVDRIFHLVTLSISILSNATLCDQSDECWSVNSSFFDCLCVSIQKCLGILEGQILTCKSRTRADMHSLVWFLDALSIFASNEYSEYREAIVNTLKKLPNLHEALDISTHIKEREDIEAEKQLSNTSHIVIQPSQNMMITSSARGFSIVKETIPMFQWYLKIYDKLSVFYPSKSLKETSSFLHRIYETKYFLPLETRNLIASLEATCISHLLTQNEIPENLESIHFLNLHDGLYSYDGIFTYRPGIFDVIIIHGYNLICEAQRFENSDDANVCMRCISDQAIQVIEESIEKDLSQHQRITAARVAINVLEIDSGMVPVESFERLVDWLATLVVDRYSVRVAASTLFPRLLQFFTDPKMLFQKVLEMIPLQCNEDTEKIIPIDLDLDELLGTIILTLGSVASTIPSLELVCVSSLFQEFSEDNDAVNQMIMDALTWLGKSLEYDSAKEYVLAMSRSILVQMLRNPRRAVLCMNKYFLVCDKLKFDGLPDKEIILSFLIYHRSINGVRGLLNYLHEEDFNRLLLASRGEICAVHLYMTGLDIIEGFLFDVANNISKMASLLNSSLDLESIMEDISDDIIINIIGHGWDSTVNEEGRLFSKDIIMIVDLVNRVASSATNEYHLRPIDAVELLIEVQKKIFAFRHSRHKVQALKATKCALLYIEDYFGIPGVLRQALAILKILIRYPTTCESACEVLIYVIEKVLTREIASDDFQTLINTIVKTIPLVLSYICDTFSNCSPQKGSSALKCVRYLSCDAPDALQLRSLIIDPRVQYISNQKDLSEFIAKQVSGSSLKVCIEEFAEMVGVLSESTRLQYIRMIQRMIKELKLRLNGSCQDKIQLSITEKALWKIVVAAASNDHDKALIDFAGELVAYFGPLGPQVLSFKPTRFNHILEKFDIQPPKKYDFVGRLQKDVFSECLMLLGEYLIEEDALVASEAFIVLQEILSTSAGIDAFNALDDSIQSVLNIFVDSKAMSFDNASDHLPGEPARDIWKLDGFDFDVWITRVGHDMLSKCTDCVLSHCANLAKVRANFAQVLLPLAFVRFSESDGMNNDGLSLGSLFGSLITENVLPHFGKYPKAANVILKALHALRQIYSDSEEQAYQAHRGKATQSLTSSWNSMYWLDIEYLNIVEACICCRSLYSALIFAEMWKETKEKHASASEFRIYEHFMQEIYSLLPEPDGLYAMSRSNDALSQLRRFEREGDWARAMVISDLAIQMKQENHTSSVLNISEHEAVNSLRRCLGNLGGSFLLSLVGKYKQELRSRGDKAVMEGAALLGEWYPIESSNDSLVSETTDSHLAISMKHFQIGYLEGFAEGIHNVRNGVIQLLASASRETTADLNPLIVRAQMAQNLQEAWELRWPGTGRIDSSDIFQHNMEEKIDAIVAIWKQREETAGLGWRFSLDMPLKDLRYELLAALKQEELKATCLLDIAISARKAGRNGQALGALSRFRQSIAKATDSWSKLHRPPEANWRIEEAKNLWAQNQCDAAVMTLISCSIPARCSPQNVVDVAYLNCVLAKWLASTQRESSSAILKTLRNNTDTLLHYSGSYSSSSKKVCRIHYRLASYANHLSKEIANKKLSVEWLRSKSILEKKIQERENLEAELKTKIKKRARSEEYTRSTKQMISSINKIDAAISEDSRAIGSADQNELEYELLAIKGYSLALKHGSDYDLPAMFRLIDIWLSHTSDDEAAINTSFSENAKDIPSYKLIPLSYQLASRLSSTQESVSCSFQENLSSLIFRMSRDHPYHMLPILFALRNGNKTVENSSGPAGGLIYEANNSRIDAAFSLINKLKGLNNKMRDICDEMDVATQGYIEIAMNPVAKQVKEMPFPAKWRRRFCAELKHVPVLSIMLPLDLSLQYKDIPTVISIDEKIRFPGGINKPKLVTITDSFGHTRRQLVKGGRDDLRQDAVMQQFFRICNAFLQEAKATASRNLSIRTYFALPFSPSSGVLEWIDHTDSLFKFISNGNIQFERMAHSVQHKLADVQRQGKDTENIKYKKKIFDECVKELGEPRMRKVFLRRFPDPGRWFEARLTYTRSVAVNSMAGHIIGLGDRHLTNILISKESAEVIHIDLGIAFEQGRLLPTPERVPFRLTRNMVDGMGATGVEGVMRRCCEETLRVLEKHKDPILTVLSVFIHDPLYNWALTYDRATKRQDDSTNIHLDFDDKVGDLEGNVDANRTLLRIQHKLEGIVGGDTTARGVEGQVQYLMSEAMDPLNLCRMYRGWQAHI